MMDSQETSFHQNRRIVLEIAHDVFMMDPSHAKQILLDETVWNACFYSRFGSLKNERLFEADLEMAASFYQNLILCIQCEYKVDLRSLGVDLLQHKLVPNLLDKSKDLQIDVLSIIYKSLIFLGDIERYKAQLSISPDNFKVSKSWYSKAFKVYPASGKSHSQIALLAAKELNNIDSIYFNSLSIGNVQSNESFRTNFIYVASKYAHELKNVTSFVGFTELMLHFFFQLLAPEDSTVSVALASSALEFLTKNLVPGREIMQLCISLLIITSDLESQFNQSSSASLKQKIRQLQVISLSFIFKLSTICINQTLTLISLERDLKDNYYAFAAGICCVWLRSNHKMILHYDAYTTPQVCATFDFKYVFTDFTLSLASLTNSVCFFVDFEIILESTKYDFDLIALSSFLEFYDSIDSHINQSSYSAIVLSRIASFSRFLADDDSYGFFKFDGKFIAFDKRKQQEKLITSLATELLKDQVARLELQQGNAENTNLTIVIPDLASFLYKLPQITSLLQSKRYIVVLSLSVIEQLDVLKKKEVLAREANRYLDQRFKYASLYLVAQKRLQDVEPQDDIFVPFSLRGVIGCALYFIDNTARVHLVTENPELAGLARAFTIPVVKIDKLVAY